MAIELGSASASPLVARTGPVRYLKLGEAGGFAAECIAEGLAYLGFGLERPARLALAEGGDWAGLRDVLLAEGGRAGPASNASHQAEAFFADDTSTIWLTFHEARLFWTSFQSGNPPVVRPGHVGVWRRVVGWRDVDANGERLELWRLSSDLTKLARFQGTSCAVRPAKLAEYARLRINGHRSPAIREAETATERLLVASVELVRLLHWRDFETFVDLIFARTGWRRLGPVGGMERTSDIDLELPATRQRAFVQVKAAAGNVDLAHYRERLEAAPQYDFMFFAYHTWRGGAEPEPPVVVSSDQAVEPLGPRRLVEMAHDAGLLGWLIEKAPA